MRDVDIHCRGLWRTHSCVLRRDSLDAVGPSIDTNVDAARKSACATIYTSPEELERAARFRLPRDRERFIACRSVLREILSTYLSIDPRRVEFTSNPHGKLAVEGLYFNLSHSDDLAIIAVSRTREVGVDIERIRSDVAAEAIAARFFSPAEAAALAGLPPEDRHKAFFRLWTRKEAYVKAVGLGLSIPLSSFEITIGERVEFRRGGEGWEIESFEPAPGYAAAVVARQV
jgi:4'-phosphopantetheinyl transferase